MKNYKVYIRSLFVLIVLSFSVLSGCENVNTNTSQDNNDTCKVIRVIDGDTIEVDIDNKIETVRLIGIDTPESKHNDSLRNCKEGEIASNYLASRLTGETVTLEYDVNKYDRYNRLLAYVYLGDEEINITLLELGYARVMIVDPNNKKEKTYMELQEKAKSEKIGFWANPSCWK